LSLPDNATADSAPSISFCDSVGIDCEIFQPMYRTPHEASRLSDCRHVSCQSCPSTARAAAMSSMTQWSLCGLGKASWLMVWIKNCFLLFMTGWTKSGYSKPNMRKKFAHFTQGLQIFLNLYFYPFCHLKFHNEAGLSEKGNVLMTEKRGIQKNKTDTNNEVHLQVQTKLIISRMNLSIETSRGR